MPWQRCFIEPRLALPAVPRLTSPAIATGSIVCNVGGKRLIN
jgi:hypothetical protein